MMLEKMKSLKDKGLAKAVQTMLNEKYKKYGRVTKVTIDTTDGRVSAELDLVGEKAPVQLTLIHYDILQQGDDTLVKLGRIECSRAWMGLLLDDIADKTLDRRRYPIENRAAAELVRKLL